MYIFGQGTGETYESMQRKRKVADAMLTESMRPANNLGQGIASLGHALAGSVLDYQARKSESAGKEKFGKLYEALINPTAAPGVEPSAAPVVDPVAAPAVDPADVPTGPDAFLKRLAARRDASGPVSSVPSVTTPGLATPPEGAARIAAIKANGGVPPGGMSTYDPVAAAATKRASPAAAPAAPSGGAMGINPQLLAALGNPYATPEQRAVMQAMVQQQILHNTPEKPLTAYQRAQLAGQEEARRLQRDSLAFNQAHADRQFGLAQSSASKSPIAALEARASAAGLVKGSPEYQSFMASNGAGLKPVESPIAALEARAVAAGLVKGSPEYQSFMARNGAVAETQTRVITGAEAESLGLDPNKAYNVDDNGKVSSIGGAQTNVTVNNTGDDSFAKEWGKVQAQDFNEILKAGSNIPIEIANLDEMEALVKGGVGGASDVWGIWAKNTLGVNTVSSQAEAMEGLINRVAPLLHPPGSGPMTDADLANYKRSLAQFSNSEEGNLRIIDTIRAIANYRGAQAKIVLDYARGPQTQARRAEALARIYDLPPPRMPYTESDEDLLQRYN